MASLDFILQGLSAADDHFAAIREAFALPDITSGIVASAFMNAPGANIIADLVAPLSEQVKVFVGIRNDVTTLQAIQVLVDHGVYPILVDTATQAFIFHPKVYLTCNLHQAQLIVGSANATAGGLVKNIEASISAKLDMHDPKDIDIVNKIASSFEALSSEYPENVFRVTAKTDLAALASQGLLIDQCNTQYHTRMRTTAAGRTDTRAKMKLPTRRLPQLNRTAQQTTEKLQIQGTPAEIIAVSNDRLLWRSRGLTRRDLNIPTAKGTNSTGSMLFKKGDAAQDIDPRSYFRNVVFAHEDWVHDADPAAAHMERCTCRFRIIINGVDYGIYELRLSHNSRTDTAAYEQRNSMTQVHWGPDVKKLIAHEDLLGSILTLYAPEEGSAVYTLVFGDDE